MAGRKDKGATRLRNTILIVVAVVVVVVIGYGTLYSTGVTTGEFRQGEHYRVLENAERHRAGAPVEVREFFSYGCIHCKNFDPLIEEWRANLPAGVEFTRTPVVFSPAWTLLAQAYLTLDYLGILEQNHTRLFSQIHDRHIQFLSADQLAEFVDGHGASKEEFLRAFNSPEVRRKLREADMAQRNMQISSVPTLVVDDRYVVNMDSGRKTALEIVDYLIGLEQSDTGGEAASGND